MRVKLLAVALFICALFFSPRAHAGGIPVIDVGSIAKQIISNLNEVRMIKNQILSLENELKNLTQLDFNILDDYSQSMRYLFEKMGEVHGLMQEFSNLQAEFEELYPDFNNILQSLDPTLTSESVNRALDESRQMMLGASKTGSAVLENLPKTQAQLEELLSDSHGAVGILQATQAGNQINATISSNLMNLTAMFTSYVQAYVSYTQNANMGQAIEAKRAKDLLVGESPSAVPPVPFKPF